MGRGLYIIRNVTLVIAALALCARLWLWIFEGLGWAGDRLIAVLTHG